MHTTESFVRSDGTIGGFSALFCDWLTELFGIRFEPKIYDWNELIAKLKTGEIAFTGELTPVPERKGKYITTMPCHWFSSLL